MTPNSSARERFKEKFLSGQVGMWVVLGILVGVSAGVGSLVLYNLIKLFTYLMLTGISGFNPPIPGGEGGNTTYLIGSFNRFLIPISTTLGGFISGYLVYKFSPGSEGLGINAAINAFHNLGVRIKRRTPLVKLVSSAVIIGSGGSAGRDGPVALISVVFGSFLADVFKLDDHDRRILMASAIGAGIGSIFMAPIGGAIMSTEIIYRKDFEVEVLIPATIASLVGYAIFGFQFHYVPLFTTADSSFFFSNPLSILVYALLGLGAGLGGRFYVVLFDYVNLAFHRLTAIPIYLKPAIGGLLVGCIAIFFPQILGLSYGWVQVILSGNLIYTPLYVLVILFFAKILATSFTVGSGGSGGVFAPSIVSGAFLGASLGILIHPFFPFVSMSEMIIVTMISFFGAVSKTPIAMLVMGTEMAGGLDMFLPLMVAITISYFVSGYKYSVYSAQVANRIHSPLHLQDYKTEILERLNTTKVMKKTFLSVEPDQTVALAYYLMRSRKVLGAVVIDGRVPIGYVTREGLRAQRGRKGKMPVTAVMDRQITEIYENTDLKDAIDMFHQDAQKSLIVVDKENGHIVGTVSFGDLADSYERENKRYSYERMSA